MYTCTYVRIAGKNRMGYVAMNAFTTAPTEPIQHPGAPVFCSLVCHMFLGGVVVVWWSKAMIAKQRQ